MKPYGNKRVDRFGLRLGKANQRRCYMVDLIALRRAPKKKARQLAKKEIES